ncbi:hypothetical protein Tsubulata_015339 [Turnera subulata]|uniref:3'(2'),5'-bisphosphate nucleotidase n=1 Tax=Turnera subulata TaxID=218843 RepID=A0A9Q0FU97_9ROSI|nr:hypothetical protein Tsubulata_015339 [Turnera subulata]
MNLLHSPFSTVRFPHRLRPATPRRRFFLVRSSLPFPNQNAKYHRELEAAVDAVERACRLCVDVKRSLFSSEGRILEKNDSTPVTVADFGVQALVSLELSKLFPTIPLVAEEDSGFLRSNNLVDSVVSVVTDEVSSGDKRLTNADVLEAIDRGGKNDVVYGGRPATYWILDPIDGTKGFLKGSDALYVVGLALVVEGEIVLGVMGCPNWDEAVSFTSTTDSRGVESMVPKSGIIMVAHAGCGTWARSLSDVVNGSANMPDGWTRCYVDGCGLVPEARFCIPDSQTWDLIPLSELFNATNDPNSVGEKKVLLLSGCCGSLCKYLMVASGRATVFVLRARNERIIKAWDHAVGIICVREAGGKVTDWKGDQIDLAADQVERRIIFPSGGVIVSNGKLHNQIVEMISSSFSTA